MENRSAVVPPRGVAEVADEDRTAVVPTHKSGSVTFPG
jgi:hypothetical protein